MWRRRSGGSTARCERLPPSKAPVAENSAGSLQEMSPALAVSVRQISKPLLASFLGERPVAEGIADLLQFVAQRLGRLVRFGIQAPFSQENADLQFARQVVP